MQNVPMENITYIEKGEFFILWILKKIKAVKLCKRVYWTM